MTRQGGVGAPVQASATSTQASGWRHSPLGYVALVLLIALPVLVRDPSAQNMLTLSMIWALWAFSLNVIWGYAGQFSMATIALGGLSAYIYVVLVAKTNWPAPIAIAAGILGSVLVSVVIGWACLRLEGFRFAIMTLAFALAGVGVFDSLDITGRSSGISLPGSWATLTFGPVKWGLSSADGGFTLLMVLVFLALAAMTHALLGRPVGRRLLAVREDAILAESLGLSARHARVTAFALSAVVAGVAGVFQAEYYRFIYPSLFSFNTLVTVIVVLVLGGKGELFGPLVGGLLYAALTNWLHIGGQYEQAVFGAALILIVIFARHGLIRYLSQGERAAIRLITDPAKRRALIRRRRSDAPRIGRHRRAPDLDRYENLLEPSAGHAVEDDVAAAVWQRLVLATTLTPEATLTVKGPLLEVEGLTKRFGGVAAVDEVTFSLQAGEVLGVIGPNGAGKTSLFNLLSGFYAPDEGIVRWQGQDISHLASSKRSAAGLARTFQQPRTFAGLTVRENLVIAGQRSSQLRDGTPIAGKFAPSLDDVVTMFDLWRVVDLRAAELSYGVSKRLGVALAVASAPTALLLDEPAAGLPHHDIERLESDIRQLKQAGCAICLVEHHMDLVMAVCDRILVLDAGRVIGLGTPVEVAKSEAVLNAYLGGGPR